MKKLLLILVWSLCLFLTYGQDNDTLFFGKLALPNTPAISLLDQNPSIIETPETGKALGLSILNAIQANKGIPQNYAVEFTPYWLITNSKMNVFKFARINPEKETQKYFFDPSKISISMASLSIIDTSNNFTNSHISIGIKCNIITVKRKADIQYFTKANEALILFMRERNKNFKEYMGQNFPGILSSDSIYKSQLAMYYNQHPVRTGIKDTLKTIMNRKPLFTMDGAAAYNFFFENNIFKECHFGRLGAWITLRYSTSLGKELENNNYFNLYGIGRYIMDGTIQQNGHYVNIHAFDFGGKAEIEVKKFAIGFEYVYRMQKNEESFRACGNIKYKLSDQLILNCAFGRNFGTYNNVIAIMGVNWGFNTGLETLKVN
jgi:hypothetical protein